MIDVGWLAQNGPCEKYSAGQTVPLPGESEKGMYILLAGRVDVSGAAKNKSPEVSLFPGDVFGGGEFFTDKAEYVYTAAVDSVVYVINESSFSDLSWSQPDIVFAVLRAAYVPQGQPTGQVKSMQEKAAAAALAKANAEPPAKVDLANDAALKALLDDKHIEAQPAQQNAASDGGALFPSGHKHYPGVTKPAYLRLVYPKDYTCPFCKKEFKGVKVFGSKLYESAPMRYDLRKYFTDFQMEWYDVITCRHCFFSTTASFYNDSKPVLKQKIENELSAARSLVSLDFDAERDIDFVFTTHYLALLCSDGYLSLAVPLRAKIWGNLSWLYEDVGDKEMEVFAAAKAADTYEEVYTGTRMTPVQEQTTCLSIVGMQRRAGMDKDIRKYLYQVKTARMGEKSYMKMAEDILEDMRGGGGV